jgi:agmatine deiminase
MPDLRLPAEWEEQSGVQLTWPHGESDWLKYLEQVEPCFAQISKEISQREKLLLVCQDQEHVLAILQKANANLNNIKFAVAASNDAWTRDHGGITAYKGNEPVLLDFAFNGWGLKYRANHDNLLTRGLYKQKVFGNIPLQTLGLVLEGGSIESDGKGTILTTSQCLLSGNRNPHLGKTEVELELKKHLGAERVLWLNHGFMAGDDTDSHIDTLARFCDENTIAYMGCIDTSDEHYTELKAMEEELKVLKTLSGNSYSLIKLPMPTASFDDAGERLPATYANFLIINGAVLVPTYNDPKDQEALNLLEACFPKRQIVGIDCRSLILQHGSLHCVTMQFPKGVNL